MPFMTLFYWLNAIYSLSKKKKKRKKKKEKKERIATALPKKVWGKKSEVKGVLIRFDCWQKNKARFV